MISTPTRLFACFFKDFYTRRWHWVPVSWLWWIQDVVVKKVKRSKKSYTNEWKINRSIFKSSIHRHDYRVFITHTESYGVPWTSMIKQFRELYIKVWWFMVGVFTLCLARYKNNFVNESQTRKMVQVSNQWFKKKSWMAKSNITRNITYFIALWDTSETDLDHVYNHIDLDSCGNLCIIWSDSKRFLAAARFRP